MDQDDGVDLSKSYMHTLQILSEIREDEDSEPEADDMREKALSRLKMQLLDKEARGMEQSQAILKRTNENQENRESDSCSPSTSSATEDEIHKRESVRRPLKPLKSQKSGSKIAFGDSVESSNARSNKGKVTSASEGEDTKGKRLGFPCNECQQRFRSIAALKEHEKVHLNEEEDFQCNVCDAIFDAKEDIAEHFDIHRAEWPFECDVCGLMVFKNKYDLAEHQVGHSDGEEEEKSAPIPKANTISECNECGVMCKTNKRLKVHLDKMHGTFSCDLCMSKFYRKARLFNHEKKCKKSKTKKEPKFKEHKCQVCNKKFYSANGLKTHLKIHTGEKDFECSTCGKKYAHCKSLQVHLSRKHENREKKFQCRKCESLFMSIDGLNNHIHRVHRDDNLSCDICGKPYGNMTYLRRHIKTHNPHLQCEFCDYKTSTSTCMRIHQMRVHSKQKKMPSQETDSD